MNGDERLPDPPIQATPDVPIRPPVSANDNVGGDMTSDRTSPPRRRSFGVATPLMVIGTLLAGLGGLAAAWSSNRSYDLQHALALTSSVTFAIPATLEQAGCTTHVPRSGLQITGIAHPVRRENIWLLVQALGVGRFYLPTGRWLDIGANGAWSQFVSSIGANQDAGQRFTLVAVATNLDADNALSRAFSQAKGDEGAHIDALPVGSSSVQTTCVVRD
jgi:hypothetical protein